MGYRKADAILPPEVVALIQQYVDGEYIYIPRREGKRRSWGETTGCRRETRERNRLIYLEHCSGAGTEELAEKYFLSSKSIQRIVTEEKRKMQKRTDTA
ncbi:MAG TPA: hypothetical protein H9761_07195 [Candidatus Eisenbergiella merdavium]|uniref:Mor transcription activator domain-containing protein n=1 Tax=Candidatus Eisenbergiella merdavium TaxID=2838551 RepID=A0A9D2NFM8_9FIRM|nr:hypothetical protein [Candidatus Eisenbergiella merdavium]